MFTASLFMIAKIWKHPRCSSVGKQINYMTFIQRNTIQYQKGISYQTIKISEGTLNAYYQVKEANLKVI